ncbi:MAG: OmpA family protein [Bacteroidota bacterium]
MKKDLLPSIKYRIFGLLVFICSLKVYPQAIKQRIAAKEFNSLHFVRSAELYSQLANSSSNKDNILKAAVSYFKIADYMNAEKYYRIALKNKTLDDSEIFNYYQSLIYNKHYDLAKELSSKLKKEGKSYSYLYDSLQITQLLSDSSKYNISYLAVNSEYSDFSPLVFNDELYFVSARRNQSLQNKKFDWDNTYFLDIYKAPLKNFNEVIPVKFSFRTTFHEGPISISKFGKLMFVTRNNMNKNKPVLNSKNQVNLQLFYSYFPFSDTSTWHPFPYNSLNYSCGHPALNDSGNVLYFISDMPGSLGGTDIYVSNLTGGKWSKPENLGKQINTSGNEMFPNLYKNKLVYSSNGLNGLGGLDIYSFNLDSVNVSSSINFGYPINTNMDDFACIFINDSMGYFSSNRQITTSNDDIFSFKIKNTTKHAPINFIVKDYFNREIVLKGNIVIKNKNEYVIDTLFFSGSSCKYLNVKLSNVIVTATSENYYENSIEVNTSEHKYSDSIIIYLKPKKAIIVYKAFDIKTNRKLANVIVNLKDSVFNSVYSFTMDNNGENSIDSKYANYIIFGAELYNYKYIRYERELKNDTNIVSLFFLKESEDLSEKIILNPIYFDLDKYNIRADAALELDKIVLYLKKNPRIELKIASHTDCRNTRNYNKFLSNKRANSTMNYFVKHGISSKRLQAVGYGEDKPLNSCNCELIEKSNCSEEMHALNRRSEFFIMN